MTKTTELSLVVAMTREHVIGRDGDMPWHIPSDLARFGRITREAGTVVMGRKTYVSILGRLGRPLPNRKSIVLTTRACHEQSEQVLFVHSINEALSAAGDCASVIGGGEIYRLFLSLASKMHITIVEGEGIAGDTYFPMLDWTEWLLTKQLPSQKWGVGDEYPTSYQVWVRK